MFDDPNYSFWVQGEDCKKPEFVDVENSDDIRYDDNLPDGWKLTESLDNHVDHEKVVEKPDAKLVMKDEALGWNNAYLKTKIPPNSASNISSVTGVNDDSAMRGNKETVTPDDMTAKPDLVDPGGWKSLMPSLENVVTRKLCLAKLYGMDVLVMDAALALKMDVHDVTMPSQLMILIKAVTEVRRVKKCFDRAVDDKFLLVKTE